MGNIGLNYFDKGEKKPALEYLSKCLEMLEESVGEEHPDFLFFVKEYNKIMGEGDNGAQSVQ
jgi:hypothetical protein